MTDNVANPEVQIEDENEIMRQRKAKLQELRAKGIAYPNDFKPDHLAACLHGSCQDLDKDTLEAEPMAVKVAGRIMTRRLMGKASFITIQDMSGRIQAYVRKNDLPDPELYEEFKKWDMGDIVAIEGTMFRTKTGELSVKATNIRLLTKSLRPLPDKWHGLQDQETRFRQRYVDLIVNEKARSIFLTRTKLVQAIRNFLVAQKFLEVETPMMHPIPGGAAARPFVTYHNTLEMELFLRIAPELYLKRLIVGGFERVFEINRNFRNEGISTRHNPEFTMLEFYQAYADYEDLMDLSEKMLATITQEITGDTKITYQGHEIDFAKPFKRLTVKAAILEYAPEIKAAELEDLATARAVLDRLEVSYQDDWGLGKVQLEIFEQVAEPKLMDPTFITAYPTEVSPLARCNDQDPFITDRFELFIAGKEIANGFSELNDAQDQADRFKAQVAAKDAGDLEAMHYDADYVTALEFGMPPTAGEGIGIDRLTMLFTDMPSIREVILFPQLRGV